MDRGRISHSGVKTMSDSPCRRCGTNRDPSVDDLQAEIKRLKELVRIHRRENWGLDGLVDGEIGEVYNHSDAQLYRSVLGD